MLDLTNLIRFLPVTHLEPETIGWIRGLTEATHGRWQLAEIELLEPPAGQAVPYIDPVRAMTSIFCAQGDAPEEAEARAKTEYAALRPRLGLIERVRFFELCNPDTPECVPFLRLLRYLRGRRLLNQPLSAFFTRVLHALAATALFPNPDAPETPWTLATLPDQPPAKALIEFIPGPPWDCGMDRPGAMAVFAEWHQHLRPIVAQLEQTLGQTVYAFRNLECEYDDDYGHRFLQLYCCCRSHPESPYVQFLVEASGAEDVETLKAALIAPENYRHPFEMNYNSCDDYTARAMRFRYLRPGERRVVGLVFSTFQARDIAERRLLELIDAEVWIVAPSTLVPDDWLKRATRHCSDWVHRVLRDEQVAEPIDLLAHLDELWVISNRSVRGCGSGLGLSPSVEDLLWMAQAFNLPNHFLYVNGSGLSNPESVLKTRQVVERVAEQARLREAFTRQLAEIRLDNDHCISGLWDGQGGFIDYDSLAIPFDLVRRIVAWQEAFEERNPVTANDVELVQSMQIDEGWWALHDEKSADLAQALYEALGGRTRVRYLRNGKWQVIGEGDI